MLIVRKKITSLFLWVTILFVGFCSKNYPIENLNIPFSGDATLEVGGPFVGVEFHHSQMIPQRISFYYPVANSIDDSQDFWSRDTTFVMDWQLSIDAEKPLECGKNPADIVLNPYSVGFSEIREKFEISSSYHFCKDKAAMVLKIKIKNRQNQINKFHFACKLKNSIKTSHTYRKLDQPVITVSEDNTTIYANYPFRDADSATIFISNANEKPINIIANNQTVGFIYEKDLNPGNSMEIVQIIGSAGHRETEKIVKYLRKNYQHEVQKYEDTVLEKSLRKSEFFTGDRETDKFVAYAKAIMETNKHYLDGEIVPMPCPAEYNFQFTHDQLVTDLAAVNFDLNRVRFDLEYIKNHADSNKILPHAYYWKDGQYQTEFASSDNWNNFWYIIVSASYLRHSNDIELLRRLYPWLQVCKTKALKNLEKDNLIWSFRPDWWDIGHNYGPKSYMTILAIKAVRDFVYISAVLGEMESELPELNQTANLIESALIDKLWSKDHQYLMNYFNDGTLDPHYYIGSLLAAHYCDSDNEKLKQMLQTVQNQMVDEQLGIYNAFPMDFENYKDIIRYAGDEVGAKYYYFNGGIWPQGNAWYSLAMIKTGQRIEAATFIKNTMSLYGIMNSPKGQPAYYEVRSADQKDPSQYGTIDKPQFLWAGAWYIYALYHLHFIEENSWNLTLSPYLPENQKECLASFSIAGKNIEYKISGNNSAATISSILYDGKQQHSLVIPLVNYPEQSLVVKKGTVKNPYLENCDAILRKVDWRENILRAEFSAFSGYENKVVIVARKKPKSIMIDNQIISSWIAENNGDFVKIKINYKHDNKVAHLGIKF